MDYKLAVVRIFVSDWERSLEFYSDTLGMGFTFRNDEIGWAELDTGSAHLALERADPDDPEDDEILGRFVGVSLVVEDVAVTYSELTSRGVDFLGPPEKQTWGGTLAHFRDPDGNVLTLFS